jgi:hypothetical protein
MTLQQIHKKFVAKRTVLVVTILVFVLSRLLKINDDNCLIVWGTTIIQIGIALSLLYLSNSFVLIRNRTLLPSVFYLLFIGSGTFVYDSWESCVAGVCVLCCLFFLFDSYRKLYSQGAALNIALLLTIGSFVWLPLLFFFPVFWYGMYKFQSLSFRSFFASVVGFVVVYLFIFTWSFHLNDQLHFFLSTLPDWEQLISTQPFQFNIREYILSGYLALLFIWVGINIFISGISDKIKVLKTLSFLYAVCAVAFIAQFLQPDNQEEWYSILCLSLSFLVADLFTSPNHKTHTWIMWVTMVFFFFFTINHY